MNAGPRKGSSRPKNPFCARPASTSVAARTVPISQRRTGRGVVDSGGMAIVLRICCAALHSQSWMTSPVVVRLLQGHHYGRILAEERRPYYEHLRILLAEPK